MVQRYLQVGIGNINKGGVVMKKILLGVLLLLFFSTIVSANPFLVCDPQAGVAKYKISGPTWVNPNGVQPIEVTAQLDGSLKFDVAASGIGINNLSVAACSTEPIWGESCSEPFPFSFTRPSLVKPSGPVNLKLSPSPS
jgi:hypothetical protein